MPTSIFHPLFTGTCTKGSYDTLELVNPDTLTARQLIEHCPGLLKIGGVEALGEPAIDLCQEFPGVRTLALLQPEPTQAPRSPQFQGFRLLAAGDVESLLKTVFCLGV